MTAIYLRQKLGYRLRYAGAICLVLLLPPQARFASAQSGSLPTAVAPTAAAAAQVSRLIVRPRAAGRAAGSESPDSTDLAEIESFLGRQLASSTPTPAGDQILELANPVDLATARRLVDALRMRDDIVWAELERNPTSALPKTNVAADAKARRPTIRRLVITFADAALAQASRMNARVGADRDAQLSVAAATPLHVARATVGGAWIVELLGAVDAASAEAIAARLESAGVARFAAPDYPLRLALIPNDPRFTQGMQWNLGDPAGPYFGIDATQAWDITTGSPAMVIAVVDTGIVAHPDLTRVLPGYDFITDVTDANDGDGRDADATDPGDWRTAGICPAPDDGVANSSWHGTFVSGILAADANNGVGIAGINWNAQILPARVLGRCGGTSSDIFAGMMWAAGLPVPGVPDNPHPAKVINMSLGGKGFCAAQYQSMINAVLDAGAFIAVSAGNADADVAGYFPASCLGISTVAATDHSGSRTSYSNFGVGMDIAAPGGDMPGFGIVSTWNAGTTTAAAAAYASGSGTSFSSPQVAGVASLMLAVNPGLSPAQIKSLMAQTATPFAVGSDCATQGICGAGIVNAFGAVQAAQAALVQPVPVQVVEFYYAARNHYFISAAQAEIDALDNNVFPGWQRTGLQFKAYLMPTAGASQVCRFYIPPPYDSHFYSASPVECAQVHAMYPFFDYESPNVFYIPLPDQTTGACPAATIPVYRLYNNGEGGAPNHRYTTSTAVKAQMLAQQWVAEGYGPNQVIMCSPQ